MKYLILFLSFLIIYFSIISGGSESYSIINGFHQWMGWDAATFHQKCRNYWDNDPLLFKCYMELSGPKDIFYRAMYLFGYSIMIYLAFRGGGYVKCIVLFFVVFLAFIHFNSGGLNSVGFIGNTIFALILFWLSLIQWLKLFGLIR